MAQKQILKISEEEFVYGSEMSQGHCLACGEQADGCEPDACNYKCECCGECKVFGFEELLIMGLVHFTETEDEN